MSEINQTHLILIVTWVLACALGTLFFIFNKNAKLKRKVWPVVAIGVGIAFIAMGYFMGILSRLPLMVPMVIIITFFNIRSMKFCDNCGKTISHKALFSKLEYCPKCGSKMNA